MNENETDDTARGGRVQTWPPYHWIQQSGISYYSTFDDFWKAKYDEDDKQDYTRFIRILNCQSKESVQQP